MRREGLTLLLVLAALLTLFVRPAPPRQAVTFAPLARAAGPGLCESADGRLLVDINTADEALLRDLPGIGEALAAAIVLERETNGPFASAEELMRVAGIGDKKLAALREEIAASLS